MISYSILFQILKLIILNYSLLFKLILNLVWKKKRKEMLQTNNGNNN
jgi:hypothetical protein